MKGPFVSLILFLAGCGAPGLGEECSGVSSSCSKGLECHLLGADDQKGHCELPCTADAGCPTSCSCVSDDLSGHYCASSQGGACTAH